jgi:ATP-dependent helicase HrpB
MTPTSLPIDSLIPELLSALEKQNAAVVVAQPGAGKTTRIPPALLSAVFAQEKEIWVLQPRRLAAKLAALRVAEELGEAAGQRVGYQFRFEKNISPATRLRFMTDGMLLPLAQADPQLSRVAAVILDEFHERSLALELSLAWLRRLQLGDRPDLRILVMSATLDAESLSAYLSNCPVFKSEGRVFPVSLEYLPMPEQPDLSLKVRSAVKHLTSQGPSGTTLVFLPGLSEIKRCQQALSRESLEVHALYGDLSVEEQQRVLQPRGGGKVILSTNVAETSLTVPGVTAVVDSGLTRQSRVSAWSGLSSLVTVPASQASAAQRAGRAGRLRAGVALRLYSKFDFDHRAAFDVPELLRTELSKSLLDLLCLGIENLEEFPWFLKPPPISMEAALLLLKRLGAVTSTNQLTPLGRRMARFPLPPRLAKLLLEVETLAPQTSEIQKQACRLAVLVSEERAGSEDLLEELFHYKPGFESRRLEEQLEGLLNLKPGVKPSTEPSHNILAMGLLSAFPDRVARIRSEDAVAASHGNHRRELLLSGGGSATATDNALTRAHEYFVVVEAQENTQVAKGRGAEGARTQAKVRSLCPIEVDWLLDLFPQELKEEQTYSWNDKLQRVEGFKRLKYDQLVLDEKPLSVGDFGPEAQALLLKQALAAGPTAYCDPEELDLFLNRVKFVNERTKGIPEFSQEMVAETLAELCHGRRSLEDLKSAGLVPALRSKLSPQNQSLLDRLAPPSVTLPTGRKLTLHYESGKAPWIQSRLQDFFGMNKGPTVAGGEVPVVLHLLSPRQEPVQITSDLAGFWQKHYPQVRKEMMRRYPRHKWPERPV